MKWKPTRGTALFASKSAVAFPPNSAADVGREPTAPRTVSSRIGPLKEPDSVTSSGVVVTITEKRISTGKLFQYQIKVWES